MANMTSAEVTAPKQRVIGRPFAKGVSGNPAGRPVGSRNRLADSFVQDLATAWNQFGEVALKRCAQETPDKFVKIVADLMPANVNLSVSVDAVAFADRFKAAAELLGHPIEQPRQVGKALPGRVIEHRDAS
jgi:hypothetical protein